MSSLSLQQRLTLMWWHAMPGFFLLAFVLVTHMRAAALSALLPVLSELPLMAIFYGCLWRPRALPYILLFAAGMLRDTLSGLPLGESFLVWAFFRWLVLRYGKEVSGQGFLARWVYFALTAFAALLLEWLMLSYWRDTLLSPGYAAVQYIVLLFFYPSFHWLMSRLQGASYRRVWFLLKEG